MSEVTKLREEIIYNYVTDIAARNELLVAFRRQAAELERLHVIEAAAWKLAEHPDSEAAKASLLRLLGVELD
jgi:3'-phosphoadenosine 5'-phosphosulfate sulfotransferase